MPSPSSFRSLLSILVIGCQLSSGWANDIVISGPVVNASGPAHASIYEVEPSIPMELQSYLDQSVIAWDVLVTDTVNTVDGWYYFYHMVPYLDALVTGAQVLRDEVYVKLLVKYIDIMISRASLGKPELWGSIVYKNSPETRERNEVAVASLDSHARTAS